MNEVDRAWSLIDSQIALTRQVSVTFRSSRPNDLPDATTLSVPVRHGKVPTGSFSGVCGCAEESEGDREGGWGREDTVKETTLATCVAKRVSTLPSSSNLASRGERDDFDSSDNLGGKVVRRFGIVDRAGCGVLTEIMFLRVNCESTDSSIYP